MGKAIELPDPLDTSSPLNGLSPMGDRGGDASTGNADDILSQLAGDEIDRLLAEADVERPPGSSSNPLVADDDGGGVEVQEPVEVETVDGVLDELSAPGSADTKSPFADAQAGAIAVRVLTPATLPILAKSGSLEGVPLATTPPTTADGTFSTPVIEPSHSLRNEVQSNDADGDPAPIPMLLKPLAWMNAPLDALPDSARELLGKIAIITLFNAAAILIYVLVFRH